MRRMIVVLFICLLPAGSVWAITITQLLEAAAVQPGGRISAMTLQESVLNQESAMAALYPKVALFGRAEAYNSPTNLRPMPPTEINVGRGDPIPFSRDILRYGLSFEVPVYVRQLYVLRHKANILSQKAKIDRKLDVLGRQAAVVSLNSVLAYIDSLEKAIDARRQSMARTRDDMALKVKSGRSPESELLKIETSLNDLDQQRNDLVAKRIDTVSAIQDLTGMRLSQPVPMTLTRQLSPAPYLRVEAAKTQAEAAQKELESRQAQRYPRVSLSGFLSGNEGQAYNTDTSIDRDYNGAALVVQIPLLDRSLTQQEAIARVQWQKAKLALKQTRIEAQTLAETLDRKLPVVERSMALAEKSVEGNQGLLTVAKVALSSGRMTMEDYLRYESNVLAAQAALYQARQQRWQILAQQAALYGTDLKGIVK